MRFVKLMHIGHKSGRSMIQLGFVDGQAALLTTDANGTRRISILPSQIVDVFDTNQSLDERGQPVDRGGESTFVLDVFEVRSKLAVNLDFSDVPPMRTNRKCPTCDLFLEDGEPCPACDYVAWYDHVNRGGPRIPSSRRCDACGLPADELEQRDDFPGVEVVPGKLRSAWICAKCLGSKAGETLQEQRNQDVVDVGDGRTVVVQGRRPDLRQKLYTALSPLIGKTIDPDMLQRVQAVSETVIEQHLAETKNLRETEKAAQAPREEDLPDCWQPTEAEKAEWFKKDVEHASQNMVLYIQPLESNKCAKHGYELVSACMACLVEGGFGQRRAAAEMRDRVLEFARGLHDEEKHTVTIGPEPGPFETCDMDVCVELQKILGIS